MKLLICYISVLKEVYIWVLVSSLTFYLPFSSRRKIPGFWVVGMD
jgi:hypothetical protein